MTRPDRLWYPTDVNFWDCPKVLQVGDLAAVLFHQMLAYAKRHPEADGAVPTAALAQMRHADEVQALCGIGWVEMVGAAAVIVDWPKWHASAARVEAKRAADRDRMARKRALENEGCLVVVDQNQVQDLESGTSRDIRATVARQSEPDTFPEFWATYPRKVGKPKALAAYRSALTRATADAIRDGLAAQLPTWTDPRYIPHPTTWLNRDGWNDQPAPMSGPTAAVIDLAAQAARLESGQRYF